jgi:hypothetical protein
LDLFFVDHGESLTGCEKKSISSQIAGLQSL